MLCSVRSLMLWLLFRGEAVVWDGCEDRICDIEHLADEGGVIVYMLEDFRGDGDVCVEVQGFGDVCNHSPDGVVSDVVNRFPGEIDADQLDGWEAVADLAEQDTVTASDIYYPGAAVGAAQSDPLQDPAMDFRVLAGVRGFVLPDLVPVFGSVEITT